MLAGLLEAAQVVVDGFQRGTGLAQFALGAHALAECRLAFLLQCLDRRVAFGKLRCQVTQARIQLATLAAHAFQRLRQRHDLHTLRFQRQCQRMRGITRFARGIAGTVAGLGDAAAFTVQHLPGGFQVTHP